MGLFYLHAVSQNSVRACVSPLKGLPVKTPESIQKRKNMRVAEFKEEESLL